MEIELKFLIPKNQTKTFKSALNSNCFNAEDKGSALLSNAYFDTPSQQLRQLDIGLRTRSIDALGLEGRAEQTVKLAGKDVAGLQQRPEYTVPIAITEDKTACFANLNLFDADIWPRKMDVSKINADLTKVFETRFERHTWLVQLNNGDKVEVVLDQGVVEAQYQGEMQQQEISEFELELVSGDMSSLFELAFQLTQSVSAKLGYLSKAARGYHLAQGHKLKSSNLETIQLKRTDALETAFEKALSYGLSFIQQNELVFAQDHDPKSFRRVIDGISLIIQALTLFSPYLKSNRCDKFIEAFRLWRGRVSWVESFYQLEKLQDRKSPYRKDIESRGALLDVLASKKMPEEKLQKLTQEFSSNKFNQLMLSFIQWFAKKGWRAEMSLDELAILSLPVEDKAANWLNSGWQAFKQEIHQLSLSDDHKVIERTYWHLAAGMLTGLVVGNLYQEQDREGFRSQLLNLLLGFEEYILLLKLEQVISQEPELEQESRKWIQGKMESLQVALSASMTTINKLKPYW